MRGVLYVLKIYVDLYKKHFYKLLGKVYVVY